MIINNNKLPIKITTLKRKYFIRRKPINFKTLLPKQDKKGFSILISGRLKGAQRARSLSISRGVIKVNSLSHAVQAKNFPVQTKWGKLGFKICLV